MDNLIDLNLLSSYDTKIKDYIGKAIEQNAGSSPTVDVATDSDISTFLNEQGLS